MRLSVSRSALVVLVFVLAAGAAQADAGPAFLSEQTYPAMRFENLGDYPAYDFYLKQSP